MTERIGLVAFWKNYDRKLYLRAAQLADDLGYDSFWVPEAWGYEISTLLTEMALATKRIKLGTGILNVYSRSPGLIAMTAATLDEISEGRFILGIGPSGKNVIEGFHGRKFDKPLTQVRDVIRVVRTLLAGGKLTDAARRARRVPAVQARDEAGARVDPDLRRGAAAQGHRVDRRAGRRLDPHVLALRPARARGARSSRPAPRRRGAIRRRS